MSRRSRRRRDSDSDINMMVLGSIVLIIFIAFALSYILYSGRISRQAKGITNNTQRIATTTESDMLNMITNVENSQAVSTQIGKSVNEMENETGDIETTTKMAVNTSSIENKQTEEKNEKQETKNEKQKDEEIIEETVKDPTFVRPVEGDKIKDYAKDNLSYSNTLEEWTTHLGIDFASQKTDIVKASADGKIKSIKNDPRYGLTVVIEHSNGFESIYSSLLTAEFITVGEEVKQGQTIATVGNTATFEIADETHLHFEIKKDGANVDPNIYIK